MYVYVYKKHTYIHSTINIIIQQHGLIIKLLPFQNTIVKIQTQASRALTDLPTKNMKKNGHHEKADRE